LQTSQASKRTLYQGKYRVETTRLSGWDYRTPAWYFVTICARNHACLLGASAEGRIQLSPAGEIANAELRTLATHYSYITIDSFTVMPNHVHFILVSGGHHRYSPNLEIHLEPAVVRGPGLAPPLAGSLSAIVRSYKAGVTRRCHETASRNFAWQPGFREHILSGNTSVDAVRDYIANNPANWLKDLENPRNRL